MNPETINFLKNLPKAEMAEVMEFLAVELGSDEEDAIIIAELDRRMAEYDKNPSTAKTWDEVRAQIFSKHGF